MSIQPIIAILLYLVATFALGVKISGNTGILSKTRPLILIGGAIALVIHAHLLFQSIFVIQGLDFGFFNAVSLVGWLVALIVMVTSFYRPMENLLLVLYPIAAIAIILELSIHEQRVLSETISTGLKIHILLSVCAYSLLMISALQAILLALQEKLIKTKHVAHIIYMLPPLQVMEQLLVQIIVVGFFLLSLSLASGLMFIEDMFAQHLVHKTILSILAWIIYGILIWGRWAAGWRGKKIIRWALGGFFTLLLAYVGTKLVLELILNRI